MSQSVILGYISGVDFVLSFVIFGYILGVDWSAEHDPDMKWEGEEDLFECNSQAVLCLEKLFLFGSSDPKLDALNETWSQIYQETFQCPAGLKLETPDLRYCKLGDFLAFMVSYGAFYQTGSGRLLGLALVIIKQVGNYLSDTNNQEKLLTLTDKRSLPLVKNVQRKLPSDNQDSGTSKTLEKEDPRLASLAYMKDVCLALGEHRSRSIAIVTDAADIKGANVSLFFAFSPCVQAGGLLPHQVPIPSQCLPFMLSYRISLQ